MSTTSTTTYCIDPKYYDEETLNTDYVTALFASIYNAVEPPPQVIIDAQQLFNNVFCEYDDPVGYSYKTHAAATVLAAGEQHGYPLTAAEVGAPVDLEPKQVNRKKRTVYKTLTLSYVPIDAHDWIQRYEREETITDTRDEQHMSRVSTLAHEITSRSEDAVGGIRPSIHAATAIYLAARSLTGRDRTHPQYIRQEDVALWFDCTSPSIQKACRRIDTATEIHK